MSELEVSLVHLESLHVAAALGYGESPEGLALNVLRTWAEKHHLLDSNINPQIFGFNNPGPHPGSPNYGYEVWLVVGQGVEADGEITINDFPGGLYAVTRCTGVENIPDTWQKLMAWVEKSRYRPGAHQWLEKHIQVLDMPLDQLVLELYMPVTES